jgi:hypothetical protein
VKLFAVHTCPMWEEPDGTRRPPRDGEVRRDLRVVGWCNVLVVEIRGAVHRLLAVAA